MTEQLLNQTITESMNISPPPPSALLIARATISTNSSLKGIETRAVAVGVHEGDVFLAAAELLGGHRALLFLLLLFGQRR